MEIQPLKQRESSQTRRPPSCLLPTNGSCVRDEGGNGFRYVCNRGIAKINRKEQTHFQTRVALTTHAIVANWLAKQIERITDLRAI